MPNAGTVTRLALLCPVANSSTRLSPNSNCGGPCAARGRLDGGFVAVDPAAGDFALSSGGDVRKMVHIVINGGLNHYKTMINLLTGWSRWMEFIQDFYVL